MADVFIRSARTGDIEALTNLEVALWPHHTFEELSPDTESILEGKPNRIMPTAFFVAEIGDGRLVGFVEVALRSYANGCDSSKAPAHIEGWYVEEAYRRQGIGRRLIAAAEDWGRSQGCIEMSSDALIDNDVSHKAHQKLGFEAHDRVVNFRKAL